MVEPTDLEKRIAELELRRAELCARLPKHSVPTAMAIQLDDLDDELRRLRAQRDADRLCSKKS